jgi:hypothetical protein
MTTYPLNTYPSRIDPAIVKLLMALKEVTDTDYPADLLAARRAAFIQQVAKKRVGTAGTVPTRT